MSSETIKSYVRLRPATSEEGLVGLEFWKVDGKEVQWLGATDRQPSKPLIFDGVFGGSACNAEVYQAIHPLVIQVLDGYNATTFAYGQTNSGKTHTMWGSAAEPGIIPLALREVFHRAAACSVRDYVVSVSYFEIYNKDVNDLGAEEAQKLEVTDKRHAKDKDRVVEVTVGGLREEIFYSADQALAWLQQGNSRRQTNETSMNKASSRSHAICRVLVKSRCKDDAATQCTVRTGELYLVDLAGSESAAKTDAKGQRQREGGNINTSLLTLGKVINELSEGKQPGAAMYRKSKLTRVLQLSLGGNAKTAIICTVTPASEHCTETTNTLRFASRVMRVQTFASVNETLSSAGLLKRQATQIEELRRQLEGTGAAHIEEEVHRLRGELLLRAQDNESMQAELSGQKAEFNRVQSQLQSQVESLRRLVQDNEGVQACLQELQLQNEELQQEVERSRQLADQGEAAKLRQEQLAEELQGAQGECDRLAAVVRRLEESAVQLADAERRQLEGEVQKHKQELEVGEARLQATCSELDAAKVAAAAAGAQLAQSQAAAAVLQGQLAAVQEQLAAVQQRAATDAQAAAAGFNLEFKAAMEASEKEHCLALNTMERRFEKQISGLEQSLAQALEKEGWTDKEAQAARERCTQLEGGLLAAQEECARLQAALSQQAAHMTQQQQQLEIGASEERRMLREQLAAAEQARMQEVEALQHQLHEAAAGMRQLEEQLAQAHKVEAVAGSPPTGAQEQQAANGNEAAFSPGAVDVADDGGWWAGGAEPPAQDEVGRLHVERAQLQEQVDSAVAEKEAAREEALELAEKLEQQQLEQEAREERVAELERQLGRERWEAKREAEAVAANNANQVASLEQQLQEARQRMAMQESKRVTSRGQQKRKVEQKRVDALLGLEGSPAKRGRQQ